MEYNYTNEKVHLVHCNLCEVGICWHVTEQRRFVLETEVTDLKSVSKVDVFVMDQSIAHTTITSRLMFCPAAFSPLTLMSNVYAKVSTVLS